MAAIGNEHILTKQFNNWRVQAGLPWALWDNYVMKGPNGPVTVNTPLGQGLKAGVGNLAALFTNPGQMSPTLSSAIAPLLAQQSQGIARQYAGIQQNAAGALGRAGLGASPFAAALEASINNAASRSQGQARQQAQFQGETLRRSDLEQMLNTFKLMMGGVQDFRGSLAQSVGLGQGQQQLGFNQQNLNQSGWLAALGTALKAYGQFTGKGNGS